MKLDTFRKRIKRIESFKLSISSIGDKSVHFLEFGRNNLETMHEFVMSFLLKTLVLFFHLRELALYLLKHTLLVKKVFVALFILLYDIDVGIRVCNLMVEYFDSLADQILLLSQDLYLFLYKVIADSSVNQVELKTLRFSFHHFGIGLLKRPVGVMFASCNLALALTVHVSY